MSDTPRVDGAESGFGSFRFVSATFARQLERELAEANRDERRAVSEIESTRETLNAVLEGATKQAIELTSHKAALEKILFECDQIESGFRSKLHKLESDLFAQTAATHRAKNALISITSGQFYKSSCRGGEMERLMNQAIESLRSVNLSQSSQ